MTFHKTRNFCEEDQELARIAKALSHPARIAILKYLANAKQCISGDITGEIPLSRTTVSQHLQELKKAKLIHGEIDGVKVNYCLCGETIYSVLDQMQALLELLKNGIVHECCNEGQL